MRRLASAMVLPTLLLLATGAAFASGAPENYDAYLDSLYEGTVPVVPPQSVTEFLQANPDVMIIDTRTAAERSVSFIARSAFHDFDTFRVDEFSSLPRDTPILAYCAVGYRSERVGEQLFAAGFTSVRHIYGGIIAWHNAGLPLETGASGAEASVVHGYLPRWGRYVADGSVVYEPAVE